MDREQLLDFLYWLDGRGAVVTEDEEEIVERYLESIGD